MLHSFVVRDITMLNNISYFSGLRYADKHHQKEYEMPQQTYIHDGLVYSR